MDMKKILYCLTSALAVLSIVSCDKKAEYNQTLGLMSEYNILAAEGGNTQVAVFSNTDWTVEFDRPVDWASIDRVQGHKSGYLEFDFERNYGRSRRVILIFKAGDQTRTLNMFQKPHFINAECIMNLGLSTLDVPSAGMTDGAIPFNTNLIYSLDEMFLTLSYPEGAQPASPWIILKSIDKNQVTIDVLPNETGEERKAFLQISHTDEGDFNSTEGDTIYSNTLTLTQTF